MQILEAVILIFLPIGMLTICLCLLFSAIDHLIEFRDFLPLACATFLTIVILIPIVAILHGVIT